MDEKEKKLEEEVTKEVLKENPSPTETEVVNEPDTVQEVVEDNGKSEEVEESVEAGTDDGGEVREEIPPTDTEEVTEEKVEEKDTTLPEETTVVEEHEKTEEVVEEPEISPEVLELQEKVAAFEREKEIEEAIKSFEETKKNNQKQLEEFHNTIGQRIVDECARYGVPIDMDIDKMRVEAPDKFNILQNILAKADEVTNQVIDDIANKERQEAQQIVFRKAGEAMRKYKLTPEQVQAAADTFVEIMHDTGIKNLGKDLEVKVELAVAHAKMIKADLDKVKEDVVKTVEDTKKAIEEVKEAKADTISDVKAEEAPKEEVKEDKLAEFKESATPGDIAGAEPINESNVEAIYASKTGKDRLKFFAEHKDLLMKNMKGMPYSDNRRVY